MKVFILSAVFVVLSVAANAQRYRYIDSTKVMDVAQYQLYIKQHPESRLVDIKQYIPDVVLDIRYASNNNFTHRKMYPAARAFARLPVVLALKQIQEELRPHGLGIKIFDAYRPYAITVKFYDAVHNASFVADPRKGSKHNRGCAVDLTLVNLKTGKDLEMPTGFDSFSKEAASNYLDLPERIRANRKLLQDVMQAHGFREIPSEWWHFDFRGWSHYPLLDIPFSDIR